MPFNQITGAKIATQTRPFPTRRFSSIRTKRSLEMAGYTLNVSGAISKPEVSVNETLYFDVVVKYFVSSVVLSNPFSIPLKYCGWVRQCVIALRHSGERKIVGMQYI